MRNRRSAALTGALVALALACAGCWTRTVRVSVVDDLRSEIFLRGEVKSGEPGEKGYDHPLVIAPVRVAHILSRIDVRLGADDGGERKPAIPTETLYAIADGVAKALGEADPSQHVVVLSIRKEKRFGLFDRDYLTSLIVYAKDDRLLVHLSRLDWEIPVRRRERLPEPDLGEHPMRFRVLPGQAMAVVDAQAVAVEWRDDVFRRPSRTRITGTGRVVRRTILMESPPEEEASGAAPAAGSEGEIPPGLSPSTLRALADLEEERREGVISEPEYQERRRELLETGSGGSGDRDSP